MLDHIHVLGTLSTVDVGSRRVGGLECALEVEKMAIGGTGSSTAEMQRQRDIFLILELSGAW